MNKTGFIKTLSKKANITEEQAAQVDEIIEAHHIIGKKSKLAVISEIQEKLGIDEAAAESISDTASGIMASAIKNKLLHPFGSDSDEASIR